MCNEIVVQCWRGSAIVVKAWEASAISSPQRLGARQCPECSGEILSDEGKKAKEIALRVCRETRDLIYVLSLASLRRRLS